MRSILSLAAILGCSWLSFAAMAQDSGTARPNLVLQKLVDGMPRSDQQEVRVMTANLKPGDKTVFHTHRSPVTVYILEGDFTLDLEGHGTMTIKAGEAYVEPPHVRMTGHNRSATHATKLVIFYVSDPGTPFLDVVH